MKTMLSNDRMDAVLQGSRSVLDATDRGDYKSRALRALEALAAVASGERMGEDEIKTERLL